MSDGSNNTGDESQDNKASEPLAGERLAIARREQQIALGEIAKELHLDEYKVRALERNDFDVIGAPVFAKGHLRKYAQLVDVSQDDVMADYYQLERSAGAPPALKLRKRLRQEVSPLPWIVALLVIIVAAAAYWWLSRGGSSIAPPPSSEIAALPSSTDHGKAAEAVAGPGVYIPGSDEPVADNSEAPVVAIAQVLEAPVLAANEFLAPGQLHLQLTYSGDCWTEITDARGKRLFFDLGSVGRVVEMSGEAPFNALFGNAANVSLVVNGAPFEISATDNRGTARMTLTGS